MRLFLAFVLLLAGPHDQHTRESRRLGERSMVGLSYTPAAFEFAPANGTGMGTQCACAAVTGYRGEAMTFTRASVATCARGGVANTGIANGDFVQCSTNQPRVESASGGELGLRIENTRTNLALRNTELNNAYWSSTTVGGAAAPTVTANAGVAPDGLTTAEQIDFPAVSAAQGSVIGIIGGGFPAVATLASIFVRGVSGSGTLDVCQQSGSSVCAQCAYVATEWRRCFTPLSSAAAANFYFGPLAIYGGSAGAQPAQSVYLWGAQVESGKAYSSSLIYTTSASATRSGDVAYFTGLTLPASNVGSAGANYSGTALPRDSTYPMVFNFSTGYPPAASGTDQLALYSGGDSFVTAKCYAGNAAAGLFITGTVTGASAAWRGSCTSGATVTGAVGVNSMTASGATSGTFNAQTALSLHTLGGYQIEGVVSRICRDSSITRCL